MAVVACVAVLAAAGIAGAAQSFVRYDIAADLSAGDAGDEIAGSATMRYRCDALTKLTNRIWFERRPAGADAAAWERVEPDAVRYRTARFADQRRAGARVRRASVRAPSFAGAGAFEFRLRGRMRFTCADHKVVAKSETLPLPGLGA
jgi:hypothetical protein